MEGEVHYRRMTGAKLYVRAAGDRRLVASVLRWEQPVRLQTGHTEWFGKGSLSTLDPSVPLLVKHSGPRAGEVIQWRSSPLGMDAIVRADETPTGDGLLDLIDRWGSVPLSPAWWGFPTMHSTGREWTRVEMTHLAVCHAGQLPWGRLRRLAA